MIVGLGKTGLSCAQYFKRHGIAFAVMDGNPAPPNLAELRRIAPDATFMRTDPQRLLDAEEIILSPGVPRSNPEIRSALDAGVRVTGDVAMFGELADAPIVAITGSNGKSTVTALVGEMARHAGLSTGIGGNFGVPCLDLLDRDFELFVIEVSSYQLETATRLRSKVATVLNLSPDHLNRYASLEDYYATKANIYRQCEYAIVSRDQARHFDLSSATGVLTFGSDMPTSPDDFGTGPDGALYQGSKRLIATDEIALQGGHNHQNALAALAIGTVLELDMHAMLQVLREFPGLAHRCEHVATIDGVDYINDSKATNVGSTLAAVKGLASDRRNIILILGGMGKNADFSVLAEVIGQYVKRVYVYGRDRNTIVDQLGAHDLIHAEDTLENVVDEIRSTAESGDLVLLSPACASQDQFRDFEARGDRFKALVMNGVGT